MTCMYCGHEQHRHGTSMPSEGWHYCQDCHVRDGHAYRALKEETKKDA
jgi:hypothetical protein